MVLYDEIEGLGEAARVPVGGLRAVGKPDLKQNRVAVSADQWQVMRGRVKIFPGISKTGTAVIEPDGEGHEDIPVGRSDPRALEQKLEQPVKLRDQWPTC